MNKILVQIYVISVSLLILTACGKHVTDITELEAGEKRVNVLDMEKETEEKLIQTEYALDVAIDEKLKQDKQLSDQPKDKTVYFDNDSHTVSAADLEMLKQHAEYIKANPQFVLRLLGFTDSTGSKVYNEKLSQKRAHAVAQELVKFGVKLNQVVISAMGPVEDGHARDESRKVEIEYNQLYTLSE